MMKIVKENEASAEVLSKLYIKLNTKPCPNIKCGVPIYKDESGCTHVQCTRCHTWMCWKCGSAAKGQKHYKEKADHWDDAGTILPT